MSSSSRCRTKWPLQSAAVRACRGQRRAGEKVIKCYKCTSEFTSSADDDSGLRLDMLAVNGVKIRDVTSASSAAGNEGCLCARHTFPARWSRRHGDQGSVIVCNAGASVSCAEYARVC